MRGAKKQQQEHRPRGPIKERSGGRIYAVDDLEDDENAELLDDMTAPDADTAETADTGDDGDDGDEQE